MTAAPALRGPLLAGASAMLVLAVLAVLLFSATADAARMCGGKRPTIVGTNGNDRITGVRGNDVIYGGGGNDRISGGPNGNDIICGGPGNDRLSDGRRGNDRLIGGGGRDRLVATSGHDRLGGGGGRDHLSGGSANDRISGGRKSDFISGQTGNDRLDGGPGGDHVLGSNGDDRAKGGPGNDFVSGGIGDDSKRFDGGLFGGAGRDFVVGDTGIDNLDGGPGADVLRGDQGPDTTVGGPGRDIASFTTASVISRLGWRSRGCQYTAGWAVVVELDRGIACEFIDSRSLVQNPLFGIEDVVGSAYPDRLQGNGRQNRLDGGPGGDRLLGDGGLDLAFGGSGFDRCSAERQDSCPGPRERESRVNAELTRSIDGSSTLAVLGSRTGDQITVSQTKAGYRITAARLRPGRESGCAGTRGGAICRGRGLDSLIIDGGRGGDRIKIANSISPHVHVTANGGAGSDTLVGGRGADRLNSGERGRDVAVGRRGGDLLYAGGSDPDRLYGGLGQDQANLPTTCSGGHFFHGGPAHDNISYAFSRQRSTWVMSLRSHTARFARRGCRPDRFEGVSSIEGTRGNDLLIGNNRHNGLIGHEGDDLFRAGGGKDYLDARDGGRDRRINCGGAKDMLLRDPADPGGRSC